ncbi:MAG: hypothetical protein ABJG47_02985 [Ekhidna sp.]
MNNKITNYLFCICTLFLLFSCNPNQELIEENERLKAENAHLRNEAVKAKEVANEARAAALENLETAKKMEKDINATYERMKEQLANCK